MSCFANKFLLTLCTLIGAIILSINIQVGLNVHLYDDIGDSSSSIRGSTSSFYPKSLILYINGFFLTSSTTNEKCFLQSLNLKKKYIYIIIYIEKNREG